VERSDFNQIPQVGRSHIEQYVDRQIRTKPSKLILEKKDRLLSKLDKLLQEEGVEASKGQVSQFVTSILNLEDKAPTVKMESVSTQTDMQRSD
jgi:hypothetical protein